MNVSRLRSLALIAGVAIALPVLGAAVMSASLVNRAERIDDIPVAIVNNDEIVTGDRPMAAGRALTDALVHPDEDENPQLGWTVTDDEHAAEGLERGDYLAVLTIPEDFSAAVLSVGSDDPVATQLTLETDPAASATAAVAARVVTDAAATTLGYEITTAFVSTTIAGVDELANAVSQAADGAEALADATARVGTGAGQVDAGVASLADGLDQLGAGAEAVASGNGKLAAGATTLADGAAELSRGSAAVASGTQQVSQSSAATAAGAAQLATALAELDASCPSTAPPQYCGAVAGAAQSAETLASGSGQVAAGAATTAAGAQTLATSSATYAQRASEFRSGAQDAAAGSSNLATSTAQAATGADTLQAGSAELVSGAVEVAAGAEELAARLNEGAAAAPTYTDQQIEDLAAVATQPVTVSTTTIGSAAGWPPAAVAAVVLWLAAVATLVIRSRATSATALSSPTSTGRLTLAVLRETFVVAMIQGVAVSLVLVSFGFDLGSIALFASLCVLAAMSLTATVIGLRVLLGRWAVLAVGALTLLQLATLSALLPIQTAPAWLAALDPLLPVSAFTTLAASLAGAAPDFASASSIFCLVLWAVIGAGLAFVGIRRRRAHPNASANLGFTGLPERMAV